MYYKGNPVSRGIGIGKIHLYKPFIPSIAKNAIGPEDISRTIEIYENIKERAQEELKDIWQRLMAEDEEKAKIFATHIEILNDPAIDEDIRASIVEDCINVDWAIHTIFEKYSTMLEKAKDMLIRERAADLKDVKLRLIRCFYGLPEKSLASIQTPVIIIAHDLLPSDTVMLDPSKTLAIVTEIGGYTSHSAIIARNLEIPALLGVKEATLILKQSQIVIVDAVEGMLITEPNREQIDSYYMKQNNEVRYAAEVKKYMNCKPVTADGVSIDIDLNISSADPRELEGEQFTDGVGLFRTEFLYMGRNRLPTEEEQYEIYKKVLLTFGLRPVTLRTLDIGGDKTLECLQLPKEDNPFLGNRALRLCFHNPDIFKTQLRAALRASVHGNLRIMFPMVSNMEDIYHAKALLKEVQNELDNKNIPYSDQVKIGIMIEIPSIAIIADLVVKEVDFASIGTNDLTQYMIAVDRQNPNVAKYYQVYHPAILRVIGFVIGQFVKAGKPICVCGEMAGEVHSAAALIGLGIRQLSMNISSIGRIKKLINSLTIKQAIGIAENLKSSLTAAEIEEYLKKSLTDIL